MPRKGSIKCYFDCANKGMLHVFPKPEYPDLDRFNLWKMVLSECVKQRGNTYIYNNIRLCDSHFESCYRSGSGRITRNAVPTLKISTTSQSTDLPVINENAENSKSQDLEVRKREIITAGPRYLVKMKTCESSNITNTDINETTVPDKSCLRQATTYQSTDLPVNNKNVESSKSQELEERKREIITAGPRYLVKKKPCTNKTNIDLNATTAPDKTCPRNGPRYLVKMKSCESTTKTNTVLNETCTIVPDKSCQREAHTRRQAYTEEVRQLNLQIQKLKAKCKTLKEQVRQARKLSLNREFSKGVEAHPESDQISTNMQPSETSKKSRDRRFTPQEMILSLTIYKQNEKTYDMLEKLLPLPSKRTLQKMISKRKMKQRCEER